MAYETGIDGVLIQAAIDAVVNAEQKRAKASGEPLSREYKPGIAIAQAQHQADVETVKGVENPFPLVETDSLIWKVTSKTWSVCLKAVLEALGEKKNE